MPCFRLLSREPSCHPGPRTRTHMQPPSRSCGAFIKRDAEACHHVHRSQPVRAPLSHLDHGGGLLMGLPIPAPYSLFSKKQSERSCDPSEPRLPPAWGRRPGCHPGPSAQTPPGCPAPPSTRALPQGHLLEHLCPCSLLTSLHGTRPRRDVFSIYGLSRIQEVTPPHRRGSAGLDPGTQPSAHAAL